MKANVFPDSEKHHVNLPLCRLLYELFWFFYKQLLLLLPAVHWPTLGQPQRYGWELPVPVSPTHFPFFSFGFRGEEMRGGQKGALLVPGIPVRLTP